MVKKILVDGLYPDSIQVAVVKDDVLTQIEYSSTSKKLIKGNIYLATITRIEPALQAAFIDYGDEKNGFISFSEIHHNYYNVPFKDRKHEPLDKFVETIANEQTPAIEDPNHPHDEQALYYDADEGVDHISESDAGDSEIIDEKEAESGEVDEVSIERAKRKNSAQYKIQEVLRRGQVLLVQAVKEIRGNKGATFTTHISLAGKYGVLMPNCASPGGVSRKITDGSARKQLKQALKEIVGDKGSTPTGFIIRTSGQGRSKDEIQSDYTYLVQLWNNIRTKTLASEAPSFIHADDSLMKKVVVDLCDRDTSEIIVQGEDVYQELMKIIDFMALESSIKITQFTEAASIFNKFHIDTQVSELYSPVVSLNSGAYIVINHTEALTSIDINSGKSTSEKNIEETAVKTNIEAAKEVARQIRIRDISGLIVIDFIDMVESRNRKLVEKVFRESLYPDKARVQLSRISMFGLLEMSRQRLRPSFFEIYSSPCKHCGGMGAIKSYDINAISMLKMVEFEIAKIKNVPAFTVYLSTDMVVFVLNHKREEIKALEMKYQISIIFLAEAGMKNEAFAIETPDSEGSHHHDADGKPSLSLEKAPSTSAVKKGKRRRFRKDRMPSKSVKEGKGRDDEGQDIRQSQVKEITIIGD